MVLREKCTSLVHLWVLPFEQEKGNNTWNGKLYSSAAWWIKKGTWSWRTEKQLIRKRGYLSEALMLSVTGKTSAPQAKMAPVYVTASQCPWLNKALISYMFLCRPRNDIPHGCESISVPAKHLPLLCCPSSSLCHPSHCLMDGADGYGCLPYSGFTQLTYQREKGRPRDTETKRREGKLG